MVTGLIVFGACKSFEKSLNQSIIYDQIKISDEIHMKIIHFLFQLSNLLRKKRLTCTVFATTPIPKVKHPNFVPSPSSLISGGKLSREDYIAAEDELRTDANTHYHTVIGQATVYEIIATVLVLIGTGLAFWLSTLIRSEDKI